MFGNVLIMGSLFVLASSVLAEKLLLVNRDDPERPGSVDYSLPKSIQCPGMIDILPKEVRDVISGTDVKFVSSWSDEGRPTSETRAFRDVLDGSRRARWSVRRYDGFLYTDIYFISSRAGRWHDGIDTIDFMEAKVRTALA